MSLPFHVVTTEALELDPADRLRLAAELIESVEGPEDPAWAEAWSTVSRPGRFAQFSRMDISPLAPSISPRRPAGLELGARSAPFRDW